MRLSTDLPKGHDLETKQAWNELKRILNYNIGYGSEGEPGNINGQWVSVTTPSTPNTDFTITHNLGRIPQGFDVKQKSGPCDIYNGSTTHTTSEATLRASAANVSLKIFVH